MNASLTKFKIFFVFIKIVEFSLLCNLKETLRFSDSVWRAQLRKTLAQQFTLNISFSMAFGRFFDEAKIQKLNKNYHGYKGNKRALAQRPEYIMCRNGTKQKWRVPSSKNIK